jgi:hypothetical protein
MTETCGNCKFFGAGESTLAKMIVAGGGSYWPSASDIMAAKMVDRDGDCMFLPQRVSKKKEDYCGQWKAK